MGAIVCVKMRFPHVVTIFPASFPVACFWGVQNLQIAMYAKGVTFGNLASWKAIVRIFYFIWQKNDWFQTIQMLLLSSWPHLCTFGNLGNPLGLLDPLDPHLSLLDTLLVLSGIFNPLFHPLSPPSHKDLESSPGPLWPRWYSWNTALCGVL